jgi:trigger factor
MLYEATSGRKREPALRRVALSGIGLDQLGGSHALTTEGRLALLDGPMQLTIEDISPVEKRVEFEVPWGEVSQRLNKAYDSLKRGVRLPGFRPGKVPREMLEKLYKDSVEQDVARELIEMSIGQAITDKQIAPVAPPKVDKLELKSGAPFKFSALVEVRSSVEPKDYAGIELQRRPAKVTDEQIANALEGYRKQLTQFVPIEGRTTTTANDVVLIEVQGKVGTNKVKKRSVWVDLSDDVGGPLPGLASRLRDLPMNADKHEVRYTLGADEKLRELASQEVALQVSIKECRERKVPALDDELAKDTGEAETLDALKEKVRSRLLDQDNAAIKRELIGQLVKEVVKRNPFPIANALVHRHAHAMYERFVQQMQMAGIDTEANPIDHDRFEAEVKDDAEQEARASVLIAAIADREGIDASDADVQKKIAELAAARQENAKKLRAELEKSNRMPAVRAQIREEKALELLLTQAKIVDADPDRLIVTPDEARAQGSGGKLIVSPEEARAELEQK